MRGIVHPVQQYPADPVKTEFSRWPIPIPQDLVLELSRHVEFSTTWVLCDEAGHQMGPWQLQRAFRNARAQVPDLPEGFWFHDLRHYYDSLLINSKLDVKVVQHGSGAPLRRRPWTPTGTCGRILTRPQGPRSVV